MGRDPETDERGARARADEALARRLEDELIAPCCFRQTVAHHDSEIATHIKQSIREQIALGRSEREILDSFVALYGEAILAEPRALGFNRLAYLTPFGAMALGLVAITGWVIARRRAAERAGRRMGDGTEPTAALRARLLDELSRLD